MASNPPKWLEDAFEDEPPWEPSLDSRAMLVEDEADIQARIARLGKELRTMEADKREVELRQRVRESESEAANESTPVFCDLCKREIWEGETFVVELMPWRFRQIVRATNDPDKAMWERAARHPLVTTRFSCLDCAGGKPDFGGASLETP